MQPLQNILGFRSGHLEAVVGHKVVANVPELEDCQPDPGTLAPRTRINNLATERLDEPGFSLARAAAYKSVRCHVIEGNVHEASIVHSRSQFYSQIDHDRSPSRSRSSFRMTS